MNGRVVLDIVTTVSVDKILKTFEKLNKILIMLGYVFKKSNNKKNVYYLL